MSRGLTLALVLALLAAPPFSRTAGAAEPACTVTVSSGDSIDKAMAAAAHGQTICVAPGTYKEKLNFRGKRIRVVGLGGPERTVIDGQGSGPIVVFKNREGRGSVLEGFTLTGARFRRGAGVMIMGASPTLRRLVVRDNVATNGGGGIGLEAGSGPLIEESRITGNRSPNGGGISVESASVLALRGVVIRKNEATQNGGGIFVQPGAGIWLSNVVMEGNRAGEHAGAIYLKASPATLKNTVFRGNHAGQWGGAMFVYMGSTVLMQNVQVMGNTADNMAGGVYVEFAHAALDNVTIARNKSVRQGGGLRLWDSVVRLRNVAVVKNSGGGVGGIAVSEKHPGTITSSYTYLQGNNPYDKVPFKLGPGPRGKKDDVPLLNIAGEEAGSWDLRLAPGSPLKDAGDPALKDPDGSRSDIGAFGGPGAARWNLNSDGPG